MFYHKIVKNITVIEIKSRTPHEPKCQRCEKRFSMCKCEKGFISTGSLMLDDILGEK